MSLVIIVSCTQRNDNSSDEKVNFSNTKTYTVELEKLFLDDQFNISLSSLIQVSNNNLFVTSSSPLHDTVVFAYDIHNSDNKTINSIKNGYGPFEATSINNSSKNITNETISFLALGNAKIIFVDDYLDKSDFTIQPEIFNKLGDVITYHDNMIAFSVEPNVSNGKLIGIYNIDSDTIHYGVPIRVPHQMQPAIRNRIFAICPIPNGFALAFLGDRKVYLINNEATTIAILHLGESDPIEEPFRINNPFDAPSSRPYIPKMEYQDGVLHILLDHEILLVDIPSLNVKTRIKFINYDHSVITPLEFTLNDSHLFVRTTRNKIYVTDVLHEWYF